VAVAASVSGAALARSQFPAGVLAAAVLAAEQVPFVLVGSAALWLRAEQISVGDADVVVRPGEASLRRLHEVMTALAIRPQTVPAVHRLRDLSVAPVDTCYGRVDCLLERGREDWDRLSQDAGYVAVADAPVLVASAQDAWALRRRFKK
jgi:hypothetical protein